MREAPLRRASLKNSVDQKWDVLGVLRTPKTSQNQEKNGASRPFSPGFEAICDLLKLSRSKMGVSGVLRTPETPQNREKNGAPRRFSLGFEAICDLLKLLNFI